MANRHTNKKLRSLVRRRMAETGESYQTALNALRGEGAARPRRGRVDQSSVELGSVNLGSVDLIAACYFGFPVTLAVFEASEPVGRPVVLRVPSSREWGGGASMPMPMSHVRPAGWQ